MKKISIPKIGFTFIGSFLGAGFVSGQELWQFFGSYGVWGLAGILTSAVLFVFLGTVLFSLAAKTGTNEMDKIILWKDVKWLRRVIGFIEISFLFGIYVIMASGAGSAASRLIGIAWIKPLICAVFCAIVTIVALSGVDGVIKLFSFIIPPLCALTLFIGVATLSKSGIHIKLEVERSTLTGNWLISALTFVSYNFFCGIGVLTEIGPRTGGGIRGFLGALTGGLLLSAFAFSITVPVMSAPFAAAEDIPMIALTERLSRILTLIYADLLFFAMFGASLSVFVPIPAYFSRFRFFARHRVSFIFLLSALAFIGSMASFKTLISVIYSVYGYLAFIIITLMVVNFFRSRNA
jgi:uncharacterized membrane protein YkvI